MARKKRGWTQTRLADELGVSPEAVSKWECGAYLPDEYNEERLNDILFLDLMEDDGRPVNVQLFNDDHMSAYLKGKLNSKDYPNASKALVFAKEKHYGQLREPKELTVLFLSLLSLMES